MKTLTMSKVKLSNVNSLTSTVKKNSVYSLLLKILSIFISFWSVRVAFEFTGSKQIYGLWLTILSVISWLGLLNAGLGNGLRNKLAQAIAVNDTQNAKAYVSTSYAFIFVISMGCSLLFLVGTSFIDWRIAFNADYISKAYFSILIMILVLSYFIQLILSTINAICFAYNESTLPSLFTFLSNLLYVICLYILKNLNISGIVVLGVVYSLTILFVLLSASFVLFLKKYKEVRPSFKYVNTSYVKDLIGNGVKFFLLEIAAVIIFTTDSMVITHVVGNEEVTIYQLVMKIFSVFTIVASTVMVPLWSAFTHAYSKEDVVWIKKVVKKILLIMIPLIVCILIFSNFVNLILRIWIGKGIAAPTALIFCVAVYIGVSIWSNFFAYFLNGINKINGQLITVGLGAILNIPLSIYFAKHLDFGAIGVVMATILCLLPFAIAGPIISKKEIKKISQKTKM
ncbi:Polysaccharide biosynthesis protein [Priestia megaterium]|uniref:hypothetical protein n=1 Tax=Priestia megaterium TaxID=1404 RepID=UPI000E148684|nr:hypothetical protein [Priestia megaterium]SUV02254.1 Polysaccharide biosynthesis protein [Priestia megaterium]